MKFKDWLSEWLEYYVKPRKSEYEPYNAPSYDGNTSFNDSVIIDDYDTFIMEGLLEQLSANYGFLRTNNYENSSDDVFVSMQNIRKFNLRRGDKVKAKAKFVREKDSAALQDVILINDLDPALFLERDNFDDLTPYYPTERIRLENADENNVSIRCIDLFSPFPKDTTLREVLGQSKVYFVLGHAQCYLSHFA